MATPYNVDVRTLQPGKTYSKSSGNPYDQWGSDWLQSNPATKAPAPAPTKPVVSSNQPQVKNQPQTKAQPKQSLFGKITHAGRDIVSGVINPVAKVINEVPALVDVATGNQKAAQNRLKQGGGLAHQGGVLGGAELGNDAVFIGKGAKKNIEKTVGTGANIASNIVAGGASKAVKEANLIRKTIKSATLGATATSVGSAGQQLADTGKISPKTTGEAAIGGAVLGGAGHIVGHTAAKGIQAGIDKLGYKTGFTNHVTNYVNHAITVADEAKQASGKATEAGMSKLSQAESLAKNPLNKPVSSTKLLTAPSEPKLLTEGKQNFTRPAEEDKRVMDGTEKLAKQYDKEYKQVTTAFADSPKRMQSEVDKLDQKYIGKHSDLINGVGEFAPKTPKVTEPKAETPVTPKPMTTNTLLSKVNPKSEVAPIETPNIPVQPVAEGEKVSGSALKTEQRAVEAGLTKEFKDKATYSSGSYKEEAANAVQLVQDNPKEAMSIAMGEKPGNNTIHEVAVAKALENKALKEGDGETLRQLAASPRHTATSESAQRLGAEGYDVTDHSPIKAIQNVLNARAKVAQARTGKTVDKIISEISKVIKTNTPKVTRQNWGEFVESLKC